MNTEVLQIQLNELDVEVIKKDIKNVHLSVYPPNGRVRVSAPNAMSLDTLRVFIISKLGWIKKQQQKLLSQEREAKREFIDRESHFYNGRRYLLKIIKHNAPAKVELKHNELEMYIRSGTSVLKRQSVLNEWYRIQLKKSIPALIPKYEKLMGVKVNQFGVKRMKTRWGSCNPKAKRIWLNLELSKKPSECLEYIVVHEMLHLLESRHNDRFVSLMDKYMPKWKYYKEELNRMPTSHFDWKY